MNNPFYARDSRFRLIVQKREKCFDDVNGYFMD